MRAYLILAALLSLPLDMWENGRLTDASCALLLGATVPAIYRLWRIDQDLKAGRRTLESLPQWLR